MLPDFFTPMDKLSIIENAAMNNQYGIQVMCLGDREKLQALVPPPLTVPAFKKDGAREQGIVFLYIVNIREPTFAPWYMEGGVAVKVEYGGVSGFHFLGLQLSGPGALMGMSIGRDSAGLPKKLADRIRVERLGDTGRCYIERDGVRLLDVECEMGAYNQPLAQAIFGRRDGCSTENPIRAECCCLFFRNVGVTERVEMILYDSPTIFRQWEPMTAKVTFASSVNDPWGEIPIDEVIGGGWMVSDNLVDSTRVLYTYPPEECGQTMQYLYTGKYDRCTLESQHQIYE